MHQEQNTSLNTTQDYLGMEWVIDKDQSFDIALSLFQKNNSLPRGLRPPDLNSAENASQTTPK